MPGHRRDDEHDDTTRVQGAVPAAGGTGGDAHGSTAVGGTPTSSRTAAPADEPTVVQPSGAPHDRTPTTPGTSVGSSADTTRTMTTAGAPGTPPTATGAPPAAPMAPAAPVSTAGRKEVVAAQRARYGGISWGSAFFGWLSANGVAVLLIALLSALGVAFGLTAGIDDAQQATEQATTGIGLGAGIALLVALFLAYLAGGYVAGRMARFDGAKQGIAVWVIGLLVVLLLALAGVLFGSQYNVLSRLDLPRIPVDEGTATTAGIISLVSVLVVTLIAAVLGGLLGARYHRKVDRVGFDH